MTYSKKIYVSLFALFAFSSCLISAANIPDFSKKFEKTKQLVKSGRKPNITEFYLTNSDPELIKKVFISSFAEGWKQTENAPFNEKKNGKVEAATLEDAKNSIKTHVTMTNPELKGIKVILIYFAGESMGYKASFIIKTEK